MLSIIVAATALVPSGLGETEEWKAYVRVLEGKKRWGMMLSATGELAKEVMPGADYNGFAVYKRKDGFLKVFLNSGESRWDGKKSGIFLAHKSKFWFPTESPPQSSDMQIVNAALPLGKEPPRGLMRYLTRSDYGSKQASETGWEITSTAIDVTVRYKYLFDKKTKLLSEFSMEGWGTAPHVGFHGYHVLWLLDDQVSSENWNLDPPKDYRRFDGSHKDEGVVEAKACIPQPLVLATEG